MKIVSLSCPSCGASLEVDGTLKSATCSYCGASFAIDDEVQHVKYDDMEQAGYEFEKGRQRAKDERKRKGSGSKKVNSANTPKKRKTWLWVLGWIFIFPIPFTILLLRNKKMDKRLRYGLIAFAWIAYLAIGMSGGKGADQATGGSEEQSTTIEQPEQVLEGDDEAHARDEATLDDEGGDATQTTDDVEPVQGLFDVIDEQIVFTDEQEVTLTATLVNNSEEMLPSGAEVAFTIYMDGGGTRTASNGLEDFPIAGRVEEDVAPGETFTVTEDWWFYSYEAIESFEVSYIGINLGYPSYRYEEELPIGSQPSRDKTRQIVADAWSTYEARAV